MGTSGRAIGADRRSAAGQRERREDMESCVSIGFGGHEGIGWDNEAKAGRILDHGRSGRAEGIRHVAVESPVRHSLALFSS